MLQPAFAIALDYSGRSPLRRATVLRFAQVTVARPVSPISFLQKRCKNNFQNTNSPKGLNVNSRACNPSPHCSYPGGEVGE
jgi:hypothetical protein